MARSRNTNNDRLPDNQSSTVKQNYTAIRYGNDHGSISFGHIHKDAEVTASVILQTPDGRHQLSLDHDGERKGWTSSTSPGNFQVECGSDNEEAQDSLMLNAKNGNIVITASNGKIRLQGTDIELVAVGEGGSKGNIKMTATENIYMDSKKLLMKATNHFKLVSSGTGRVVANSILTCYGSIFRGVDDSCAVKDAKNGGKRDVRRESKV